MTYISKEPNIYTQYVRPISRKEEEFLRKGLHFKKIVKELRNITDAEEYRKKKIQLPYRLVHGYPKDENDPYVKSSTLQDNGRLLLDFDHQDAEEIRDRFAQIGYERLGVLHIERSLSGNGCHVDVRRMEGLTREQNITYYENLLQLHIDHSCKDIGRKCLLVPMDDVLYTTNEYYETTSIPMENQVPEDMDIDLPFYKTPSIDSVPTDYHRTYSGDNMKEMEHLIDRIYDSGIDITNTYDSWYRIGFSISTECGIAGASLFHKVSSLYPGYSYHECDRKYRELDRNNRHDIHIGTLIWLAREFGAI